MDYFDPTHIDARTILLWFLVLAFGWFVIRQTKRLVFTAFIVTVLALGVAWMTGVVTRTHLDRLMGAAQGVGEAASDKARAIGDQRYNTTRGKAGTTNEAYKERIDKPIRHEDR